MNDDFETRVTAWMRDRARPDPASLTSVLGMIDTLPTRRRARQRGWLLATAVVLAVVAVGASSALMSQWPNGSPPTGPSRPVPPDPAAFFGDPRLELCRPGPGGLLAAFEMAHVSDYERHFPNAYPLIGLTGDPTAPALVAVYAGLPSEGRQPSPATSSLGPNDHGLCIVVGEDSASWSRIGVVDVDTTGMIAVLPVDAVPPDPAAFAGDPRLTTCMATAGPVEFVFEMPNARDYQRHFPAWRLAPELDVDEAAFAVVFARGARIPFSRGAFASDDAASPKPYERTVCVLVAGVPNFYEYVDISGLRADLGTADATSPVPSRSSHPSADPAATPTVAPAPAWAADLVGQLECDGPAPGLGGEVGEFGAGEPSPTPDAALQALLDMGVFASFPAGGFEPAIIDGHWARHEYRVDGRIRALAVTTDQADGSPVGDGWHVVGIRACDASEFDPADGLSFNQTLWLDAAGKVARSETIHSSPGPEHCGWQSAILLRFEGLQYVRDPDGVLAHRTFVAFDADITRPHDAVDTGLHTVGWRIHTVPAGDAVYIVTGDGTVERWGRARDLIACA